jgi:hypothetical protein
MAIDRTGTDLERFGGRVLHAGDEMLEAAVRQPATSW